jgi:PTS system nitrogen regulatory IIA component
MELVKPVFDVGSLAKYLGLSPVSVYRLLKKGGVPGKKIGGVWRFPKDAIDQWLKDRG